MLLLQGIRRRRVIGAGEYLLRIHAIERVARGAELTDHLDLAATILEGCLDLVAAQRTEHAFHTLARAGAAELPHR